MARYVSSMAHLICSLSRKHETKPRLLTGFVFSGIVLFPFVAFGQEVFQATVKGDVKYVEAYIKAGGNVNVKNDDGATPLMWAASNNRDAVAKLLIEAKADVNLRDKTGETALMNAVQWGSGEGMAKIVRLLINAKADLNAKQPDGMTALMYAAFGGKAEGTRLLIQAGADITSKMTDGMTALDWANRYGHYDIAEMLKNAGAKTKSRE